MAFGRKQQQPQQRSQGFGAQPGQQMYNQPAPKKKKESESLTVQVKKQATIATIAVVVAILAAVFAGFSFFNAKIQADQMSANTIPVVVATQDIPLGTAITDQNVQIEAIPQAYLVDQAITQQALETDPMAVLGHTAVTTLPKGTQITPNLISGSVNASSLANVIEGNNVAVTIATGTETGLANLLKIGDYVNVVLPTESASGQSNVETVVEKVKVVALDGYLSNPEDAYASVTLEVTPDQAAKIRAAQLRGTVYLTLISSASLDATDRGTSAQQQQQQQQNSAQNSNSSFSEN